MVVIRKLSQFAMPRSAGSEGLVTAKQSVVDSTGYSTCMYYDQIPMVTVQLLQAPALLATPILCDYYNATYERPDLMAKACTAVIRDLKVLLSSYEGLPHGSRAKMFPLVYALDDRSIQQGQAVDPRLVP